MKITHVFKDGSTSDSLDGKIIKVKGNEEFYQKLERCLHNIEEKKRGQAV